MIDQLFDEAQGYLEDLAKICPKGAKARKVVFDRFKASICSESLNVKSKERAFKKIKEVLGKTEKACPAGKEPIGKLKELLDTGETVKCGGPN